MIALYVAALVAALGAFGVQLAFGHHDAAAGHDVSHGDGEHDPGAWSLVASIRFWSFALLAFGLVGTALTAFGLAGSLITALLASGTGLASGLFAVIVIRGLTKGSASSHGTDADVVGRVGRVVIPLDGNGLGKVRIEIKGSFVDYVARAKEPLAVEDAVLVEECESGEVVVSRAPKELKP